MGVLLLVVWFGRMWVVVTVVVVVVVVTKMSTLWKPTSAPATRVCTHTYTNWTPNHARLDRTVSVKCFFTPEHKVFLQCIRSQ